jgi:hypothetical protein
MSGWIADKGNTPTETDTRDFAEAAVRMAREFSATADALSASQPGLDRGHGPACSDVDNGMTFEELVHEWQRDALKHWSEVDKRLALVRFQRYFFLRSDHGGRRK